MCLWIFYLWSLLATFFFVLPYPYASGTLHAVSTSDHHQVQRADVEQDLILMFSVVDENISWYLKENIQTFCSDPDGVDPAREDFQESNMMHGMYLPIDCVN